MVSATQHANRTSTFVIRPNQAPAWREIKIFFACIAATSLAVAIGFSLMGYWPVLPFAGLELLALGAALYYTAKRTRIQEVVQVDSDRVEVAIGREVPDQRWHFNRAWAQVALKRSKSPLYPSRLVIRSHGRELELGSFLIEEERHRLFKELRDAIAAD